MILRCTYLPENPLKFNNMYIKMGLKCILISRKLSQPEMPNATWAGVGCALASESSFFCALKIRGEQGAFEVRAL